MIAANENQNDTAGLDLVVFKAGQFQFAVESSWIRRSGDLPDYPIPEIETLLSIPESTIKGCRRSLVVKGDSRDYEISIVAPLDLYTLPINAIHPLPAAIAARCKLPGLRAFAIKNGELILVIDPHNIQR